MTEARIAELEAEVARLGDAGRRDAESIAHWKRQAEAAQRNAALFQSDNAPLAREIAAQRSRAEAAEARVKELEAGLTDACAHLNAAASAYRKHAARHSGMRPRAVADPLFSTRAQDFDNAADRARALLSPKDKSNG